MDEVMKFDEWMWKIKNKFYLDNERMTNAYNKILTYKTKQDEIN